MRKALSYIVAFVFSFAAVISCGRGEKVIPKDDLSEIYAEMFLMDQWIFSHPEARRSADTSFVYEPIFEKYGYTSDDFRTSMDYYLKDPDKFARILKETSLILEDRLKELRQEKDMLTSLDRIAENKLLYAVEYDFGRDSGYQYDIRDSIEFYTDTSGCVLKVRQLVPLDTLFDGPALIPAVDSLAVSDSTAVSDSLGNAVPAGKDLTIPVVVGKPDGAGSAVIIPNAGNDSPAIRPSQPFKAVSREYHGAEKVPPRRR